MSIETAVTLSVYRHVAGECVLNGCEHTNCACLDEARSLGLAIADDVSPKLTRGQKVANWFLVTSAFLCFYIIYDETGSTPLKILATLGVIASLCRNGYELLTGRNEP